MTPTNANQTDSTATPTDAPTLVVGGGPAGRDAAARLATAGETVTHVDRAPPTDPPPGYDVRTVDSLDAADVRGLRLGDANAVVALGADDASTLLVAQHARIAGVDRVLALVTDPERRCAFDALDVETVDAASALGRAVADRW
ncbi:NAD-binding protein [Halobacterium litoreum]|uniref:NAD-binding protein n=1 Tax=Halobacterium litoreum TaxID=2039234 RepID=A0ABD5NBV3_9EURY|nr:NAD-binding protein [Halobacterium litoreum]UHH14439.1 NAD-binding protein [Halobacterium litoreum]